jgi:hypothetical protein
MATLIEIVDELGKVRLAPIVLPALKMVDPILASLPRGSFRSILSSTDRSNNLVGTVEAASPSLPAMIRMAGHLAESRLVTGLLSLTATVSAPMIGVIAPLIARTIVPLSGPALSAASRSGRVMPSMVRMLDRMIRGLLFFERKVFRLSAASAR